MILALQWLYNGLECHWRPRVSRNNKLAKIVCFSSKLYDIQGDPKVLAHFKT
jgi:hypothetical protein